ncbi:MAG: glycosyltransferase family 4 protein [Parachlamydiales bacterium]|jgi:UDP-glucose:(heptosyl)LPS alpha-1,3-glucosyltransferase
MLILKNQISSLGGLEKQTLFLCRYLLKQGHEVTLLTTEPDHKHPLPNLPEKLKVHFFKRRRLPHFLQLLDYSRQVKKYLKAHPEETLVLGLDKSSSQNYLRLGNGLHKVFLKRRWQSAPFYKKISFFFDPRHYAILFLEKKALSYPALKRVVVNSTMVFQELVENYAFDPQKISLALNGVEWQNYQKPFENSFIQKAAELQRLQLPEKAHHFLFIGNGFERKGLKLLLQALALLKTSSWHLSVVGQDKKAASYHQLARKLGLRPKVSFFGHQANTLAFYSIADTFVLPTYYDPFANTTLEALAMGLFTVTSAFNGGCEVISPKNGRVLEKMQPAELAKLIEEALFYPKTKTSAQAIRESIRALEMEKQLQKIIDLLK